MDQFDDLPDVVKKDDKPKFQTEVHQAPGQLQQVSTWHVSLFGANMTENEPKQNTDQQLGQHEPQEPPKSNESQD